MDNLPEAYLTQQWKNPRGLIAEWRRAKLIVCRVKTTEVYEVTEENCALEVYRAYGFI